MKRFKYSGECFVNDGGDSFFLATGSQSNFKGTMHARHIIWTSNASINEHYTISVILQYGCCCCYCCGGGNGNGGCSHLFVMTRKWMSVCRLSIFRCRWCETTREIKRTQKINYFTIWTVSMECFLYGSICVSSSSSVLLLFFPLATKFFFFSDYCFYCTSLWIHNILHHLHWICWIFDIWIPICFLFFLEFHMKNICFIFINTHIC